MISKVFTGKTKEVYFYSKDSLLLEFRDTILGHDGIPDPGGNEVIGMEEGKGISSMRLSEFFFDLFSRSGIKNHFICAKPKKQAIIVKKAKIFGKGLEFICRMRAYGSFLERFSDYAENLQELDYLVEITIKNDQKKDPLINAESLVKLGIISNPDLEKAIILTRSVAEILNKFFQKNDMILIDIKLEFGKLDNDIIVIDTMSPDNMRVIDKTGNFLQHKELVERIL